MANPEHLAILKQGVKTWNEWREKNPDVKPDLSEAYLSGANFSRAYLSGANLIGADLSGVKLGGAYLSETNLTLTNLSGADLSGAFLSGAIFGAANLSKANLGSTDLTAASLTWANVSGADLSWSDLRLADLSWADLSGANLSGANLSRAILVETNLERANLTDCSVYGISAWGLKLEEAVQSNLIITRSGEPAITVDNLEVAQFIYLLLNNEKIRDVINTITTKVVLILGRFTPERKAVLEAIREELRRRDYLPVLFDFDKPATRDITETMRTLAHLSRFIIADISEPSSIPLELQAVVPDLAVPVQPLLLSGQREFSMFVDLRKKYHWVLATHQYTDINDLLPSLGDKVVAPAEQKAKELEKR